MTDAMRQALTTLRAEREQLEHALKVNAQAIDYLERLTGAGRTPSASRPVASRPPTPRVRSSVSRDGQVSWAQEVEQVLRDEGRPMHVRDIIDRLASKGHRIEHQKALRDTISGVVGRKARNQDTFEHVAPGTFGLLEWGKGGPERIDRSDGLSQSAGLVRVVDEHPGLPASEVVSEYAHRQGESEEEARAKRNSRVTRLGQLAQEGRISRGKDGRYWPAGSSNGLER